jgi:hypothetical protein
MCGTAYILHTGSIVSFSRKWNFIKNGGATKPMEPLYRVLLEQLLKGIQERKITYGTDPVMMAILTVAQESIEGKLNRE